MTGIVRVIQRFVIVSNPFFIIGLYQCLIQKLPFLMVHIRYQQAEENMELLNFGGKLRFLNRCAIQQFVHRLVGSAYLHNIDTVF